MQQAKNCIFHGTPTANAQMLKHSCDLKHTQQPQEWTWPSLLSTRSSQHSTQADNSADFLLDSLIGQNTVIFEQLFFSEFISTSWGIACDAEPVHPHC